MRCFGYLAARTIRTSADGQRMLALYGPFARAYDVSGPDTEERIVRTLTWAYRVLTIPVIVLLVFLSDRQDAHSVVVGLAATFVVGWLIVRAFLHPELRRLRRIDRPSRVGTSSTDFISQLGPSDRALLRRRRRFFLAGFIGSCTYALIGVAMVFSEPAFGYFAAVFFACCAVGWWTMFRLPPESVLPMRSTWALELPSGDVETEAPTPGAPETAKPAVAGVGLASYKSPVWDKELDGNP